MEILFDDFIRFYDYGPELFCILAIQRLKVKYH